MTEVFVCGVGMIRFGKYPDKSLKELGREAVNAALELPKADMPKLPRQNQAPEGAQAAGEMLKVLLKLIAEKQGVAAKIIANSEDLERIASEGPNADVGALKGWRRELFGDTALKLINGEVALRFVDRKIEAVEL